ncbi:MAG: SIS domain-containing protein, partial [Halopseudomonas aestusnigri]|nr:SIS domain-containing protein [Halopseudomonas aestusnigri]
MADFDYIASASRTISMERDAVDSLLQRLAEPFTIACDTLLQCHGRVVVTGMGKSGHVGRKLAATLASTGTPAFFVHPGEASHGDLGMITKNDIVIALSNSGNTAEIATIIPILKRFAVPLISMTGDKNSTLANQADINLDV